MTLFVLFVYFKLIMIQETVSVKQTPNIKTLPFQSFQASLLKFTTLRRILIFNTKI